MKRRLYACNTYNWRILLKSLAKLLSLLLISFFPSHNRATTLTDSQADLEKRVDAARANLLDLSENSKVSLYAEDNTKQLAQWYNWPNGWRNWYNGY